MRGVQVCFKSGVNNLCVWKLHVPVAYGLRKVRVIATLLQVHSTSIGST
jgi:hypothetical protein